MNKNRIIISIILLGITFYAQEHNNTSEQNTDNQRAKQITEEEFDKIAYSWSRTFAEMLNHAQKKHYRLDKLEECMVQALDGFLNCLDPHSDFLGPQAYKKTTDAISGEFFGIGVIIDATRETNDKFLMIVDTIPDGPSDKTGIRPMDKIVEINGKSLDGMSTDEATTLLKGPKDSTVHIKVIREGQSDLLEFDIVRDVVKEQVLLAFYLEQQQMYYVALTMFTSNSAYQLEELLKKAENKKVRALILDLRNNTGGLLDAAIDIIGLFTKKESIVVRQKDRNNKVLNQHVTKREPLDITVPIFILVNNFTASAAEILAGCLKQHSEHLSAKNKKQKKLMVFIVGSTTFGKGSVQEVIPVSNNSAVKITTSLYFLPDDVSIQGVGITPDFIVERSFPPTKQMSWFTKFYGREQSLKNYIKTTDKKEEEKKEETEPKHQTWAQRAQKRLQEDNQFKEALTLANLYHVAQTSCPQNVSNRLKAIEFMNSVYVGDNKLKMTEVKI